MPEMELFGRHLRIASDDLVFPGSSELFMRVLWWIGTMILFTYHKDNSDCNGKGALHEYLVGLLVVLALTIISLCAVVYVSAQGSIMKPRPRRSMPALLYLRALLYVPELVWACLGVAWLSGDSQGCDPVTVGAVITIVTISWIVLLVTGVVVLFVFDPLRNLQGAKGSKVWENRFHLLCCCLPQDESHQAAFSNIAKLFSDYFSVGDTERNKLVPSDVAAGLALLHQEQDRMELSKDPNVVVDHSPSSPIVSPDHESELEKAAHFMKYAAAAYGWPLYVYSNPLTGPCKLCGACCRSHAAEDEIVEGDCRGCHFSTILQSTGLKVEDFIHVSYTNEIHEKPFFVALDRTKEAVLVAVRGTLSLEDVVTDLNAVFEKLDVEGVSGDGCYAHMGMCKAVDNIYKKLINDGILNDAFSKAPEYKLVITGHSLGAGIAALLAIRLHNSFPTLQCYSFSPPGGLLSKALADYSKDFVVSVVLGKDLVPRLSISNMNDLKSKILDILNRCNKPKYRVLLKGCWYELCGGDPDGFSNESDNRREEELSQPQQGEESLIVTDKDSQTPLRLFLPGRVLHITEDGPTRRTCCSQVRYHAVWSNELEFLSILISPRMFLDHMPDAVLRALNSLTSKRKPSHHR